MEAVSVKKVYFWVFDWSTFYFRLVPLTVFDIHYILRKGFLESYGNFIPFLGKMKTATSNFTNNKRLSHRQFFWKFHILHLAAYKNILSHSYPQKQPLEVLYRTGALKNFANFTGKHLCWSLFLIKLLKRGFNTGVLLCLTQVFSTFFIEHLRWLL